MSANRPAAILTRVMPSIEPQPINQSDLRFVQDELADFAPEWCVQLEGICADEATLVMVPELGDDETGPSFVVSREGFRYRLHTVHWDDMQDLGGFATLADVMGTVRDVLLTAAEQWELAPTWH